VWHTKKHKTSADHKPAASNNPDSRSQQIAKLHGAKMDSNETKAEDTRVPVTVLTGFLGSGKTTLLNRILTMQTDKKYAVIENEYGTIGVDEDLVKKKIDAEEEIFEMNNGCICCTVRGDLIRILTNLLIKRKTKLDGILIETTGLADPAPVAQTFFADEGIKARARLDGIVTVVDAKHIMLHLDEEKENGEVNEALQQVAFADKMILNKMDLVTEAEADEVVERVKEINKSAQIIRTTKCEVAMKEILGLSAFELDRAMAIDPLFMEEAEAPTHEHKHDHSHGEHCATDCTKDHSHDHKHDEHCQKDHKHDEHCEKNSDKGKKRAHDEAPAHGHSHGDHNHAKEPEKKKKKIHKHSGLVTSVGLVIDGEMHMDRVNDMLGTLLQEKGPDIYRMKGVFAIVGNPDKFVFQGVHQQFNGEPHTPWGVDEKRRSKVVFIGKRLDKEGLETMLKSCVMDPNKLPGQIN
jgi:G3E family GTPase